MDTSLPLTLTCTSQASGKELSFSALREALDEMYCFALTNAAALPRYLLYEAILQRMCGELAAAEATLRTALAGASVLLPSLVSAERSY